MPARCRRSLVKVQDRYAVDDREHAALAAEDAVVDPVAVHFVKGAGDQFETAAAIRAAQDL
jgi:hypothetical protein